MSCKGVFARKCVIDNRGKNNAIFISKGSRLNRCKVEIFGDGNTLVLGGNCIGNEVSFWLSGGSRIDIGNDVHFAGEIRIASLEGKKIHIGNDCLFSSEIRIRNGDSHSIIDSEGKRINPAADICIGDHVWIGQQVVILKGATIGRDSIVGIRSLVTGKDFSGGVILAGAPAKIIRSGVNWKYDTP